MKVGIVGPQENKWLPFQSNRVKQAITTILWQYQFDKELTMVSGGCPLGGVDIWAEEVAKERGINTDIIKPDINQWEDDVTVEGTIFDEEMFTVTRKGFKSRNIAIAKDSDVVYCLVPKMTLSYFCKHCKEFGHPSNGGCWTMNYAKKLGKETHLVIIE